MSEQTKLPADIELEDRLAFGLTARQLLILAATAVAAYLTFTVLSSVVPAAVAAALATPVGIVGVALAVGRRDGVSADRLALFAARHLALPRRRVNAPEGLPAPRRGLCVLELPVRSVLRSGLVELAGGAFCVLLEASGASFQLRGEDEQAGLVEAFGRFLNSLTEPVQVVVRGEPLDLAARAEALERDAESLPDAALRDAACGHARFLEQLADGQGVRRRELVLVLTTRARDRHAAAATLTRRAGEACELLAGAAVTLRVLDGERAAALVARTLDPPGPPHGTQLQGAVCSC